MKIFRISDNDFIVVADNVSFPGNMNKTIKTLLLLGVEDTEVQYSLSQLMSRDDHVAELGIGKTFIFSKKIA